jgi:hypothetical protein
MRHIRLSSLVSALALIAATPALAQEATLAVGAEIQGTIADGDGRMGTADDGYLYDDYRFTATAGQRLRATMSAPFDAYIELFAEGATDGDPIAFDDDGAGADSTDAVLSFVAPADGTYVLRARTFAGFEGGDYTLSLTERPPAAPIPRPGGIRLDRPIDGTLADGDPETDDGTRFDHYSFRARAGDRLAIGLASEAFDPVVSVGRLGRDGIWTELARNDDGPGGGLNSALVFTAPEAGDYVIRASSVEIEGRGDYRLTLARAPDPAPAETIAIGDSLSETLSAGDGVNAEGLRTDAWRFTGQAGQRVQIDATSDAFDTFVELFDETSGTRTSLAQDDDGGPEGTNSRLTHTLPSDGDYVVEVRAYTGNGEGAYTLSIVEAEPERAATPLAFGATLEGEIDDTDPRDEEGRGYDAYGFTGQEGNRVQVIMRSGDFDTLLQIGLAGDFEPLATDDDGLGEGTDSRLNFTLPETGDYVIRASPLGTEEEGLYSIELIDRGPQPVDGSIIVGATARGTLTETDALGEDGSLHDAYAITVAEGDKLRLTLVSNEFDSVIEVGKAGEAWVALETDDDGLSDTHARLDWTVEEGGDYLIRARAYAPGQTGAYALTVEPRS